MPALKASEYFAYSNDLYRNNTPRAPSFTNVFATSDILFVFLFIVFTS